MLNYEFPTITNISEVLPHVQGRDEFIVADKGSYTVINYILQTSDTFRPIAEPGDLIRRECRGLVFDSKTGEVIARRYHKFFNINEREETLLKNLDFSQPHVILEKLDGSMITAFFTSDGTRHWGTKMGETDVAAQMGNFLSDHREYDELICMFPYLTFIFEWCSPQNRIVVGHPDERLVLTAVRGNGSGIYLPYNEMVEIVSDLFPTIPIVKALQLEDLEGEELINTARGLVGEEGYVVRWNNGHMVKVKSDWYVAIHKAKEDILYERNVARLILEDKLDDVKSFVLDADRDRLSRFENDFNTQYTNTLDWVLSLSYQTLVEEKMGRKEWAIAYSKLLGPFSSIIFRMLDRELHLNSGPVWANELYEAFRALLYSKTNSNSGWEGFKKAAGFTFDYNSAVPTE